MLLRAPRDISGVEKCSGSFLRWGSRTFLMGSVLLWWGTVGKGCIPREQGSPVLTWDQSCVVDSLRGGT